MYKKLLSATVCAAFCLQSHAQTALLPPESLAAYSGKTVVSTAYPMPSFNVFKAGNMAFGLIGVLASRGAGNELVKTHGIDDPALRVGQAIAAQLASAVGGTFVAAPEPNRGDDVASVLASAPNADVLIDVKTEGWGYSYIASAWSHYTVSYRATLRVISTANKTVLATTECQSEFGKPHGVTDDQLLADKAAVLKYYLQQAQFACTDQFAKTVFGFTPLPRPKDALVNPTQNIQVDNVAAIPDIMEKGRDDYRTWLAMPGPKAFAIARNGNWSYASSIKPAEPTAPTDPIARALFNCKRNAKQTCQLYAINGKVVYGSDFAARREAAFEKGKPSGDAASVAPTASSAATTYAPSGYADIGDVDLVPYLSDRGRSDYAAWIKSPTPKAFAISPSGNWSYTSGAKPKDPTMPIDPVERALAYCQKNSPTPCKVYAVNADVVFNADQGQVPP